MLELELFAFVANVDWRTISRNRSMKELFYQGTATQHWRFPGAATKQLMFRSGLEQRFWDMKILNLNPIYTHATISNIRLYYIQYGFNMCKSNSV